MKKFESFIPATSHAAEQVKTPHEKSPNTQLLTTEQSDYLINLQTKSWGNGEADYNKYAEAVWDDLIQLPRTDHPEIYTAYHDSLISNLHHLAMQDHVYPHVRENIAGLIEKYADTVKDVVLWSTGDVSHTGFQVAKIDRSKIITDFYKGLQDKLGKKKAKEFMRDKTSYMVDDDKFARIVEYAVSLGKQDTDSDIKMVIIEDSRTNVDTSRELIAKAFLEEGIDPKRLNIIPIWTGYGRQAKREAEQATQDGTQQSFDQTRSENNTIDTLEDLLTQNGFEDIFKNAHVFVDFDGVISNDTTRRIEQTQAVYDSVVSVAENFLHIPESVIHNRLKDKSTN